MVHTVKQYLQYYLVRSNIVYLHIEWIVFRWNKSQLFFNSYIQFKMRSKIVFVLFKLFNFKPKFILHLNLIIQLFFKQWHLIKHRQSLGKLRTYKLLLLFQIKCNARQSTKRCYSKYIISYFVLCPVECK